ncbi:Rad9/Ddc1 [Dillenia turbinata]|uniref:Rad9/Ddc1 n=1 Tax=Dillenia turbinata TaxID=194707 RepID=A0AAN8YST3_9MAGN
MELSLSGNALKTFSRSITWLTRLALHTLSSSHSAYLLISFNPDFFDAYTAVCSVLRTPIVGIDKLCVDIALLQWDVLNNIIAIDFVSSACMKKSYRINCNSEPEIQHLYLDRRRFPSNFVVRPHDLNRLLANFQSSLQEITVIATELHSLPSDDANEIGGKAVELRSYIDPTKDSDSLLHTLLWIDPSEEFVQYAHGGDPVDVTFAVKELKVSYNLLPVLIVPKFGPDDTSYSNYDATLVLATMLTSQLHQSNLSGIPPEAGQADFRTGSQQQDRSRMNTSDHPSDHTRIWSEFSGSGTKSSSGVEEKQGQAGNSLNGNEERNINRISTLRISKDRAEMNDQGWSPRHPSNWVDADEEDDDAGDNELRVESTPPYIE